MPTLEPRAGSVAGSAAGVPYVAFPPAGGARQNAPVIVAWHPLDPPRSETALAAAVPLSGVDAWKFYFGLPLSGTRLPNGGLDGLMELVMDDAVLRVHGPVSAQAVEEFGPALSAVRSEYGIEVGPLGLLGGSLGGAVAMSVLASKAVDVAAAVFVNPLIQLRAVVDVLAPAAGLSYEWTSERLEVADRLDFVARAGELAGTPLLYVLGENDHPDAFHAPARQLVAALDGSAESVLVPGMGHGFADEPGLEPAPQTADGAAVERLATEWFVRHLPS